MGLFRSVNMSFWTDAKVVDDYTAEDRYFMLWALTNNYTNIIGCYEVSIRQISNDLGYTKEVVENLLKRFINVHKTIDYDFETKELLVLNWNKYNWNASPKLDKPLQSAIEKVKSDNFYNYLVEIYNDRASIDDTLSIPYRYPIEKNRYPIDTTITITNTITNTISNTNTITNTNSNTIKELEEEFNNIWIDYPKKQGKKNAFKSYANARKKGVEKETIIQGLENYLNYIKIEKIQPQYIKNGSTWFNQECWNDDYSIKREMTTADLVESGLVDFSKFR